MNYPDTHRCAATGCTRECPRRFLMCRIHWTLVPRPIQSAVYATYTTDTPTLEYVSAVRAAIAAVAKAEGQPIHQTHAQPTLTGLPIPDTTPTPPNPAVVDPRPLSVDPEPAPETPPKRLPITTLPPEVREAAQKAVRVLVAEGLGVESKIKRRLWNYMHEGLEDIDGSVAYELMTVAVVEGAARQLRPDLKSNQEAATAIARAETALMHGQLLRAHGKCSLQMCSADIHWIRTPAGKATPLNLDGTPHWGTCPGAKGFKRK